MMNKRVVNGIRRLTRRFGRDQRGGTAVQMMVLLPVIMLTFVSGIKLWETIMIRRSLHTGTYLATRFLSLYPPESTSQFDWEPVAQALVYAEMKNNPFVDRVKLNQTMTRVTVTLLDGGNQCTDRFEIEVEYRMFGPWGSVGDSMLPGLRQLILREQRVGEVICD